MIQTMFFTPECAYSRQNAPQEGMGCFRIIVMLPDDAATVEEEWLMPHELHCPFDPVWRAEKIEILWKTLGRSVFPDELTVIERCTKARAVQERDNRGMAE